MLNSDLNFLVRGKHKDVHKPIIFMYINLRLKIKMLHTILKDKKLLVLAVMVLQQRKWRRMRRLH